MGEKKLFFAAAALLVAAPAIAREPAPAVVASAAPAPPATTAPRELGLRTEGFMRVRGVPDASVKIAAGESGWALDVELPEGGARCRAELRDVSPIPGHLLKWIEWLPTDAPRATLTLDPKRYLASHTYRWSLRCGLHEVQHAYVLLLAPTNPEVQTRFDLDDGVAADGKTEIAPVPKGQL